MKTLQEKIDEILAADAQITAAEVAAAAGRQRRELAVHDLLVGPPESSLAPGEQVANLGGAVAHANIEGKMVDLKIRGYVAPAPAQEPAAAPLAAPPS